MSMHTQFATHDFPLASLLLYEGFSLQGIERQPNGRAIFLFERKQNLDEAVQSFWARTLQVDPLGYHQAERALKSRLYSER